MNFDECTRKQDKDRVRNTADYKMFDFSSFFFFWSCDQRITKRTCYQPFAKGMKLATTTATTA